MVLDIEKKETITLGFDDIDIWPAWCVRDSKNCRQCQLQGKIACRPQFRKGLKHVTEIAEVSIASLLKQGKTPIEVQKLTGAKIGTIYSWGQRLRRKGELTRLLREAYPEEQKQAILKYVREHPDAEYKEVSKLFDIEPSYISRLCNRAGIHRRKLLEAKKEQQTKQAIDMLRVNPQRSVASIADDLGMASTTLITRLRKRGVLPVDHATRLVLDAIRGEVIAAVLEAFAILRNKPGKGVKTSANIDKFVNTVLTEEQMAIECLKCDHIRLVNGVLKCKTENCKYGYILQAK